MQQPKPQSVTVVIAAQALAVLADAPAVLKHQAGEAVASPAFKPLNKNNNQ